MSMSPTDLLGGNALNAGSIYCRIAVEHYGAQRALRDFNVSVKAAEQAADNSFGQIRRHSQTTAMAMTAVAVAGTAATLAMVKLAAQYEQTRIAMTSMIGSADMAQQHLDDLRMFAMRTPFQFMGLTDMSRQLQAYGFAAKEVIPAMTAIGDAVSALGGSEELLNRVVLAIGQIRATGKTRGEELRQLASAGIPALRYLSQELGVTVSQVQKLSEEGKIAAEVAIPALFKGMTQQFGGMMAAQMETTAGRFSNLRDKIEKTAVSMGTALLPTANRWIDTAGNLAEKIDNLTDSQKAMLGQVALGVPLTALAIAGLAGFINITLGATTAIGGLVTAHRVHMAQLIANGEAVLAYGLEVQAVGVAQMQAATTAMEAALALEEEALATGAATEADIAYIAAEKEKARQMLMNAAAANTEANALIGGATATRATFWGLTGTMWAVVAVIGAAAAAWYFYEQHQRAAINETTRQIAHAEEHTRAVEADLKLLDAQKARRQSQSTQLQQLADEYERLRNQTSRTTSEQLRLAEVKRQITGTMRAIRTELGEQRKAWDGNAASVRATAKALVDFSEIERKVFLTKAKLDVATEKTEVFKARKERQEAARALENARKVLRAAQTPAGEYMDVDKARRTIGQAMPAYRTATSKVEIARITEAAAYAKYMASVERLRMLENMTPEEIERLRKEAEGAGGPAAAAAATTEQEAERRRRSIREELDDRLHAIEQERQAAQLLGHDYDLAAKRRDAYQEALDAYLTPDDDRRALEITDSRVDYIINKLKELQPQLTAAEQAAKAQEIGKRFSEGLRDIASEEGALGVTGETMRRRTETIRDALVSYIGVLGTQASQVSDLTGQYQQALAALKAYETRQKAVAESTRLLEHAEEALSAQYDVRPANVAALIAGLLKQSAAIQAMTNPTADEAALLVKLQEAIAGLQQTAGILDILGAPKEMREANAHLEAMLHLRAQMTDLMDDDLAAAWESQRNRELELVAAKEALRVAKEHLASTEVIGQYTRDVQRAEEAVLHASRSVQGIQERIADAAQRARDEILRQAEAEQQMAIDAERRAAAEAQTVARMREQQAIAEQKDRDAVLEGMRAAGILLPEVEKLYYEQRRDEIQRAIDDLDTALRMADLGRIQSTPEQVAAKQARLAELRAELREIESKIGNIAQRTIGEAAKAWHEEALAGFGDALWDYQRDKGAIREYFGKVVDDAAKQAFQRMWERYTKRQADKDGNLQPSELEALGKAVTQSRIGRALGLDQLGAFLGSATGKRLVQGATAAYSAYSAIRGSGTTDAGEGRREGMIAGGMAGFAAFGLAGAAIGAFAGGLYGASEARKRAEAEAARQRDMMLSELRKLNNTLTPVSDYFRAMSLNLLPSGQTFGGMATSYAVATSRGTW